MVQLLNEERAAEILSVTTAALRRWRRELRGPRYVKVGRLIRYRESDLETWIDQNTKGPITRKGNVARLAS
jgi:predicted DNA-binding transcriptional regulator AlpA